MSDIDIRIEGHAGRITLQRPNALNAMTYQMCSSIDTALRVWKEDPEVKLVIIDALGVRAFCAGGDIADLYASGIKGDFRYGQNFWAMEYRMNQIIATYPKPYISFMQGFTMGGGVGISCHGSHRIVGESSKISMPECGIGLVPDVGGSHILARAPGHLGEYLGLTAYRMNAADSIYVGFADNFIPESCWPSVIKKLQETGDVSILEQYYDTPSDGALSAHKHKISEIFNTSNLGEIVTRLTETANNFSEKTLNAMLRNSPLSMACFLFILRYHRKKKTDLSEALIWEYRFTARAMQYGDFIEGIRATIIDKDGLPNWKHGMTTVPKADIKEMFVHLGDLELSF